MANLPYGRPGSPSWNYAMRQQASGTYDQNKTLAVGSYAQSEQQLNEARNLLGNMGSAVVDLNFYRATAIYPQVNTFLGYAQSSADAGYEYTNLMKPQADTPERQADVADLDQTYYRLTNEINNTRNSSTTLLTQASEGEFTSRTVQSTEALPNDSSGSIVQSQQDANANRADVQNPSADPLVLALTGEVIPRSNASTGSNALGTPLSSNTELGLSTGAVSDVIAGRIGTNQLGQQLGQQLSGTIGSFLQNTISAPSDDLLGSITRTALGTATAVGGRPVIANEFLAPIVPRPNKLANLASQTYTVSIYLLNKGEYKEMVEKQTKYLGNKSIIMQSGGISGNSFIGQRNKYFDVDFYIDEVEIHSAIHSQATSSPHNVLTLKFSVIEPNGITLLNRLDAATRDHAKLTNAPVSNQSQNYLMVIRFYGYDSNGKLLTAQDMGINEAPSDPNAFVEKWIPFTINTITYQIASKGVEYKVSASVPQTQINFSQSLGGEIPFNIELLAPDVKTLFNGPVAYSTTQDTDSTPAGAATTATAGSISSTGTAPPKANAITPKTITQGLAEALNQFQQDLVKDGTYEIADQYEIILDHTPGLIDATLTKQGRQDKTRSNMQLSNNPSDQKLGSKNSYDKSTKNYEITAGTQITQAIDQIMRASSYITSQQNISYDELTQKSTPQTPVSTVQWYRIQGKAVPIGYDRKRRNYASKITYTITPYQINDPRDPSFPRAKYRGTHKLYNYWFTGQNTEVLDFVIEANNNYLTVVGNGVIPPNTADGRYFEKRAFQTRPNESSQGGKGTSTMPAASLASRLYSYADVTSCEIQIIGDPDWLQQSEVFYLDRDLNPFKRDGSVNSAASEVLFEMRFNAPTDYNPSTGLTPVYKGNTAKSQITGETNLPSESIVFAALTVDSYFKQGKFTQRLKGNLREFQIPSASSTTQPVSGTTNNNTNATTTSNRDLATQRQSYEPFDTEISNAAGIEYAPFGGDEKVTEYAPFGGDEVVNATANPTGTGTSLAQSSAVINEDAGNDQVLASNPTPTVAGQAPDDDAGYDP